MVDVIEAHEDLVTLIVELKLENERIRGENERLQRTLNTKINKIIELTQAEPKP